MAQLGARFHGMEEVTGSIPVRSTKQISVKIKQIQKWGKLLSWSFGVIKCQTLNRLAPTRNHAAGLSRFFRGLAIEPRSSRLIELIVA